MFIIPELASKSICGYATAMLKTGIRSPQHHFVSIGSCPDHRFKPEEFTFMLQPMPRRVPGPDDGRAGAPSQTLQLSRSFFIAALPIQAKLKDPLPNDDQRNPRLSR
jgi:hypothetical protein